MAKNAQDRFEYESLGKKTAPPSLQKKPAGLSEEAKIVIFGLSLQFAIFLIATVAMSGVQP